jgi:hypothetical protein
MNFQRRAIVPAGQTTATMVPAPSYPGQQPIASAPNQTYYFVLSAEEDSIWEGNAPTSPTIEQAFNAATSVVNANGNVAWVSPQVRIVRSFTTGALRANVTRATDVVAVQAPDAATALGIAQTLGTQLDQQLASTGNWQATTVAPFDPAVNGDLSWWSCGGVALTSTSVDACSAVTQTRDQFPELAARFQANENPTGPTSAATHPQTIAGGLQNLGQGVASSVSTVALLVGIGVVGWWALSSRKSDASRPAPTVRGNPRRRRNPRRLTSEERRMQRGLLKEREQEERPVRPHDLGAAGFREPPRYLQEPHELAAWHRSQQDWQSIAAQRAWQTPDVMYAHYAAARKHGKAAAELERRF